ncbi:MAG: glycosyl hydrolase [Acidobacteriota bacterium]
MKAILRPFFVILVLASPLAAAGQEPTKAPSPPPTPAPSGAASGGRKEPDPLARSQKEPSREERTGPRTGKGANAEKAPPAKGGFRSETFSGLELRSIGPAVTSGRVVDLAVDPENPSRWFVASADGGVWRTVNAGTTFQPVFDAEASHSIGCVTIDPRDPFVVWVGSGENNSQRVVGYGDGVYKSTDGGETWKNMGLKTSEHISKILVDPRDSNVVFVAAQGPLWGPGGERGLYKSKDGGKTWTASLTVSENTGVTDVAIDPRDPDTMYASAYQRRRHVFTLIDGGPESAIYKSVDGGGHWTKITSGLPKEEMGRIGLAVSPAAPDTVYAVIEAANKAGGFYRSTNRGETWERRGDYVPGGPQYYNEIFADPSQKDRVYSMDVWIQVTDDGGKTFHKLGEPAKHPDNHVIWIDPENTDHYIVGCDGGVYESFDRAASWGFKANLPVTQFYRVSVDESSPAYMVYGGTQDNFSLGGPSRTTNIHGIANSDWFVTQGGDGFQSQIDPQDPNTVYAEAQYGVLTRFDRRTGESLVIQPQAAPGEPPQRWNWDSPLIISPHSHTRLYFAAQRIFRSDDRGGSWKPISGDLTRQIDRNRLKVMGRVWSADAVARNTSTSFYGNLVSLSESPLQEGLLYAGSDDGLIQVTEDGGATWRKSGPVPGVPDLAYVSRVVASPNDVNTVYASFDNHKNADFKPYAARSTDRGRTWSSIAGDLPARGTVWVVLEDPGQRDLLFAGTEYGLYFTRDGGRRWIALKGGLPNVAVRDLAVQKREGDLAVATFGRGFYILDDLTPLRQAPPDALDRDAILFPVRRPLVFIPQSPLGIRGKAFQGESYFTAPNPPFGAVFTWYLKDELKSRRKTRQEREKDLVKQGKDPDYPTREQFRAEASEEDPALVLTISDTDGHVVRRLKAPATAGFHRIAWDLRYPPATPVSLKPPVEDPFNEPPSGPMVVPGRYSVSLSKVVGAQWTNLSEPQTFEARGIFEIPPADRAALLAFERKVARLQRAVTGAEEAIDEAKNRIAHIKQALLDAPDAPPALASDVGTIEARLREIEIAVKGDAAVAAKSEPVEPAISDRVGNIVGTQWTATAAPTGTSEKDYAYAAQAFRGELEKLRALVGVDLKKVEDALEIAGAPWTPGRLPVWKPE